VSAILRKICHFDTTHFNARGDVVFARVWVMSIFGQSARKRT